MDQSMELTGNVPGLIGEVAPPVRSNLPGYEDVNEVDGSNGPLLARARQFYDDGIGAFEENRRMHSEDLNFIYNSEAMGQWDPVVLEARRGKPCYTFNRVIGSVNIVVSDMRQVKPSGKVRPASDGAKETVADILGGMCRSIELQSRADNIYKGQYKYAVAGGFGAWYLQPEYQCEGAINGAFNQVLRIVDIPNPQCVVWDPECNDPTAGDAMKCMIADRVSRDKFMATYRGNPGVSFNFSRDSYGWFTDKEVRIASYYERIPTQVEIALMSDGSVQLYDAELKALEKHFDEMVKGGAQLPEGTLRVTRTRASIQWKVLWMKMDGSQVLEGPVLYDWKRIPVVRVPGRYVNIEGRKKLQGMVRHAKDAQRTYNSRCSDMIERSVLIPKAPYLVTAGMIKGYEVEWAQANTASRPYLPFNIDKEAFKAGIPVVPTRAQPIDMPEGAMALAQQALSDIQATLGMYDPALGNADEMNRVSGTALVQHTARSDLGTFEFKDGYGAALQLTWEMAIDMIPKIYDTKQIVRIIGEDGIEKLEKINHDIPGNPHELLNDLSEGTYDCTVTIGPDYVTQRQETLQTLIDAAKTIPSVAQLCGDLLAKNIDSPDAQEMARRLRIPLIHQGIVQPTPEEQKQMPPPPQPSPAQQAQTDKLVAQAHTAQSNAIIAHSKANASSLEQLKVIFETAGSHLKNILAAQKLGEPSEAASAEAEANAAAEKGSAQAQAQPQPGGSPNVQSS